MYGLVAAEAGWVSSTAAPSRVFEGDLQYMLDLDGWQNLIKDVEDEEAAREALDACQSADIGPPKLWAWMQKEIKALNRNNKGGLVTSENKTSCARTEEIMPISDAEKSEYLPHLANKNTTERLVAGNNYHTRSRSTRHLKDENPRLSHLNFRTKLVYVGRSRINGWGLYSLEDIKNGDMIIEYVGEVIRDSVADFREGLYRRSGTSTYMFSLNPTKGIIIDGTRCGNIARFINHSHEPNCIPRVIEVMGEERICIFAKCGINKDDELTLNYNLNSGDPCHCGASACTGFI